MSRELAIGLSLFVIAAGLGVPVANAREARPVAVAAANPGEPASTASVPQGGDTRAAPKARLPYYVDFRARTASSYGHAFIWFGRTGERKVEVAGLHPATDSVIPYIIGHVLPVPSETGASYGDLDEDYVTAKYRIYLTEPEAKVVFAYIKQKQANSPLWNAATYNCVMFISDIARFMGLVVPGSHLLYPEDWVNQLRALNRGRQTARMTAAAQ
jgi:hypothetical protein